MEVLNRIQLVDVDQICFHEPVEPERLKRTCQAIKQEEAIRHPIIVTSLPRNRYLILDGAHRATALRDLGCEKIPVQIVDSTEIAVEAWDHLLSAGPWLDQLQHQSSLYWTNQIGDTPYVAEVVFSDQTRAWIYPMSAITRLEAWHEVVHAYSQNQAVHRLPQGRCISPNPHQVLFRFPTLSLEEIKEIVLAGQIVPAGVTRSIVQGRILNLHVPLDLLTSSNRSDEWIRFCEKKVNKLRLYTERIYLCEA